MLIVALGHDMLFLDRSQAAVRDMSAYYGTFGARQVGSELRGSEPAQPGTNTLAMQVARFLCHGLSTLSRRHLGGSPTVFTTQEVSCKI